MLGKRFFKIGKKENYSYCFLLNKKKKEKKTENRRQVTNNCFECAMPLLFYVFHKLYTTAIGERDIDEKQIEAFVIRARSFQHLLTVCKRFNYQKSIDKIMRNW